MGFIIKTVLIAGFVAVIAYAGVTYFSPVKESLLTFTNPIQKEKQLLTELNRNLASMEEIANQAKNVTDIDELRKRVALSKQLLEESRALVSEIKDTNNSMTKALNTHIQNVTDSIVARFSSSNSAEKNLPSCPPTLQ